MIRVCYVIPSLAVGGTERQLLYLIEGLVQDHEITVICTTKSGSLIGEVRRLGAFVRVLELWTAWDFRMRRHLARSFRSHRPDIVHTFLSGFDLAAGRAAVDSGAPVIISSRRELATWMKPRHLRHQKKANAYVDCIVANSHTVAEHSQEQEGENPERYRVIHNGIRAEEFVSTSDDNLLRRRYKIPFNTRVVGMVANFSPVKDHELFVATARELTRRRPDIHFLLVGSGPEKHAIARNIADSAMADFFTIVSSTQEIPDLYRLMDVFVLCSKVEGFPNAVMEAMASSTPVVASAVGGIPELVEDGVTGTLVNTRSPSDFADAIERMLEYPDDAKVMASRGAASIRSNFTVEKMTTAYRKLYIRLLSDSVKRSG